MKRRDRHENVAVATSLVREISSRRGQLRLSRFGTAKQFTLLSFRFKGGFAQLQFGFRQLYFSAVISRSSPAALSSSVLTSSELASQRPLSTLSCSLASFTFSMLASSSSAARSRFPELLPLDIKSANRCKNRRISAASGASGEIEMDTVIEPDAETNRAHFILAKCA
jgi:hypothetical protein